MAKLYFYYGAMGASKTAQALMAKFNYEQKGQKVILAKPATDTRDGATKIRSRIGLEAECEILSDVLNMNTECFDHIDCIIVDECQFATKEQIDILSDIVDFEDVPVICYGLRTDFMGNLFEGSKRLMEIADKIAEIKVTCFCGRKALFNARYNENGIVREGAQVQLGADDSYVGLCRYHYKTGLLGFKTDNF